MRPRLYFWLATLPLVALAEPDPIEWRADRPLVWSDFVGSVPALADRNRAAASSTSIAWSYRYALEWDRGDCRYRILEIDSTAAFHPDESWVRPDNRSDEILQHEQLHFDITRLFQQRFEAETRNLVGARRPCSGRNERRAARNVEREVADLIGTTYETLWRSHLDEQAAYDRETRHSIDRTAQAEWIRRIRQRLDGR